MNGDFIQIVDIIDTLGTFGVLIFVVVAFFRGSLISRKVHDDIVGVYQKEAEKLTTAINGSLMELTDAQEQSIEIQKRVEKSNNDYRAKIDVAVTELISTTQETAKHLVAHEKNTQKLIDIASQRVIDAVQRS